MCYIPFISYLKQNKIEFYKNYLGAKLNYFEVGGNVKIVVYPKNIKQLCDVLREIFLKGYKYYLLGNGSNVYISDYYDGIIVSTQKICEIYVNNNYITALCGANLSDVSFMALNFELSDLEFAFGIPGTVGGAIYMNASAYGGKISNIVYKSTVYDIENDVIYDIYNVNHNFYDKHSIFIENSKLVILKTIFRLDYGIFDEISIKMKENLLKRIKSQPLEYGSAGSAFKRPKGNYASRLIDECELKGYFINDAMVSNHHAGFIINNRNAKTDDINKLIEYIQKTVYNTRKINLEKEIILVE